MLVKNSFVFGRWSEKNLLTLEKLNSNAEMFETTERYTKGSDFHRRILYGFIIFVGNYLKDV